MGSARLGNSSLGICASWGNLHEDTDEMASSLLAGIAGGRCASCRRLDLARDCSGRHLSAGRRKRLVLRDGCDDQPRRRDESLRRGAGGGGDLWIETAGAFV